MAKRIFWKKGMRLTDEVLILSDNCTAELIGKVLALNAGGNFGLFPGGYPFSVSLDINKNIVEVVELNCLGITRDGTLIDVHYDTAYTNSSVTRATIPAASEDTAYFLCVYSTGELRDTNDGMCEPAYSFAVIEENSPVPANALPVAHLVYDEYCWRMDEIDFVPPCLYISSHAKYGELYDRYLQLLTRLDHNLPHRLITPTKDALKIFWPVVQQLLISIDKERNTMTPMMFFASIQKCVSAFVLACKLDEGIQLAEEEEFRNYVNTPYSVKDVFLSIRKGLELCATIVAKVDMINPNVSEAPEVPRPSTVAAPTMPMKKQRVKFGDATFSIKNNTPGAIVHYTIDGTTPTAVSPAGTSVVISSGFTDDPFKEPSKRFIVKAVAIKDGRQSAVATFNVEIQKGNPIPV